MPIDMSDSIQIIKEIIDKAEMARDPISSLGTSATESAKAFQDLQEASKDLVDLEIVIPEGHATDPQTLSRAALDEIMDQSFRRGVYDKYHTACEMVRASDGSVIHKMTLASFGDSTCVQVRIPWYKRLWSWLRGIFTRGTHDGH